jgi:hydroxypyruvate reductase
VLLPYLRSATHETREAMTGLVVRNVGSFLRDGVLLTPVSVT